MSAEVQPHSKDKTIHRKEKSVKRQVFLLEETEWHPCREVEGGSKERVRL